MDAWIANYNAYEHQRWSKEFERSIDSISEPLIVDEELTKTYNVNPNTMSFWVNVTKQPQNITDRIRGMGTRMPTGYNNIACYWPSQKMWGLKFACC